MSAPDLKQALRIVETFGTAPLLRSWNTRPKSHFGASGAYSKWVIGDRDVQRLAIAKLEEHGASIKAEAEVRIRFAGVTASSSMGLRQALTNWKTRAEIQLRSGKGAR